MFSIYVHISFISSISSIGIELSCFIKLSEKVLQKVIKPLNLFIFEQNFFLWWSLTNALNLYCLTCVKSPLSGILPGHGSRLLSAAGFCQFPGCWRPDNLHPDRIARFSCHFGSPLVCPGFEFLFFPLSVWSSLSFSSCCPERKKRFPLTVCKTEAEISVWFHSSWLRVFPMSEFSFRIVIPDRNLWSAYSAMK